MKCSLCGFKFCEAAHCSKCVMCNSCKVIVKCPNCGYSMMEDSSFIKKIKKIFFKKKIKENKTDI